MLTARRRQAVLQRPPARLPAACPRRFTLGLRPAHKAQPCLALTHSVCAVACNPPPTLAAARALAPPAQPPHLPLPQLRLLLDAHADGLAEGLAGRSGRAGQARAACRQPPGSSVHACTQLRKPRPPPSHSARTAGPTRPPRAGRPPASAPRCATSPWRRSRRRRSWRRASPRPGSWRCPSRSPSCRCRAGQGVWRGRHGGARVGWRGWDAGQDGSPACAWLRQQPAGRAGPCRPAAAWAPMPSRGAGGHTIPHRHPHCSPHGRRGSKHWNVQRMEPARTWPASSTPRPAIFPSLIIAVITPAACAWSISEGHGGRGRQGGAGTVQGGGGPARRQKRRSSSGGGRRRQGRAAAGPNTACSFHAMQSAERHGPHGCWPQQQAAGSRRQAAGGGQRRRRRRRRWHMHAARQARLACRRLPHQALRHGAGLQGIVQAQAANVGVRAYALDPGEVPHLGIDPQVRRHRAGARGGAREPDRLWAVG